jgi:hypothetical protein
MQFCRTITLYNYGQFTQTITALNLSSNDPGLSVQEKGPIDIPPGGRRDFTVCYQHIGDTAFMTTISVSNGCIDRPIALLPLVSGIDSVPPVARVLSIPCQPDVVIDLRDEGVMNAGVATITQTRLENAELTVSPTLPAKSTQVRIHRIDPRQDLIYAITVKDAVGLDTTLSDTVGGFTLAVLRATGEQVGSVVQKPWEYPDMTIGQTLCDTLYLENYGLLPLELRGVRTLGNIEYSIPPEQLPIVLAPNERRPVRLCVTPQLLDDRLDTLAIDFGCGFPSELVQLRTAVQPLIASARDRCNNAMTFIIGGYARRSFLSTPTPNPARGATAQVTFGLSAPERVTMLLFDARGVEVRRLLDGDQMPGGVAQIDLRIDDLPIGIYYLRMQTAAGDLMTEKIIIDR